MGASDGYGADGDFFFEKIDLPYISLRDTTKGDIVILADAHWILAVLHTEHLLPSHRIIELHDLSG